MHVQREINNSPCAALGGAMTPSHALFGAPDHSVLLPDIEEVVAVLGFTR